MSTTSFQQQRRAAQELQVLDPEHMLKWSRGPFAEMDPKQMLK